MTIITNVLKEILKAYLSAESAEKCKPKMTQSEYEIFVEEIT